MFHLPLTESKVPKTQGIEPDGVWSLLVVPVRMQEVADVIRRHLEQRVGFRNCPWVVRLLLSGECNVQIHFFCKTETMPYSSCNRLQLTSYRLGNVTEVGPHSWYSAVSTATDDQLVYAAALYTK